MRVLLSLKIIVMYLTCLGHHSRDARIPRAPRTPTSRTGAASTACRQVQPSPEPQQLAYKTTGPARAELRRTQPKDGGRDMEVDCPISMTVTSTKATAASAMPTPTSEYDLLGVGPRYKRGRLYSSDAALGDLDVPHQAAQLASTRLEQLSLLDIFSVPHVVRNTGIVCTIGTYSGLLSPVQHIFSVQKLHTFCVFEGKTRPRVRIYKLGKEVDLSWSRMSLHMQLRLI